MSCIIALYFGVVAGFWTAVGAGILVNVGVTYFNVTGLSYSVRRRVKRKKNKEE